VPQPQIAESVRRQEIKVSDVKEYLSWRAKTTLLLTPKTDNKCVQSRITKVVAEISKHLRPFVTSVKPNTWTELQEIVEKAVRLDLEVRKSRAVFEFTVPCSRSTKAYGFSYDKHFMTNQEGFPEEKDGMMVDLVVTPFLAKTGNADGDAYDIKTILSKCIGICRKTLRKISAT